LTRELAAPRTAEVNGPAWLADQIRQRGYVVLGPSVISASAQPAESCQRFQQEWERLPIDEFMHSPSQRRYRRYGRVRADTWQGRISLTPLPSGPFVQKAEVMPLYMGRARTFAPIDTNVLTSDIMSSIIRHDAAVVNSVAGPRNFEVGVHMIRVRTEAGKWSVVTPEARHRDGHDFVAMHLISRDEYEGGDSIIYGTDGRSDRIRLARPGEGVIVDDRMVEHEVEPVQGLSGPGHRDMLILDFEDAARPETVHG
jgi:hypothetical protein